MGYISSSNDDHVLTEVVGCMEIDNHIAGDLPDVINVSEDRLAHHVLSINIVVHVFHQSFFRVLVSCFKLLPDSVLLHF